MNATPDFPIAFRGFDEAAVRKHVSELEAELEQARQTAALLTGELSTSREDNLRLGATLAEHERAMGHTGAAGVDKAFSPPSWADLGERITAMLKLAEEESESIRGAGQDRADELVREVDSRAALTRDEADRYAARVRSTADVRAAQILESAEEQAESVLEAATTDAAIRRAEGVAHFESLRARAATAASEFEAAHEARRDQAEREFAEQMAANDAMLADARDQVASLTLEAQTDRDEATEESRRMLESAKTQAADLLAAAQTRAARIHRDSERELAAATVRRDAITAQLGSVRSMLATLGGAGAASALFDIGQGATAVDSSEVGDPFNLTDVSPDRMKEVLDGLTETDGATEGAEPNAEHDESTEVSAESDTMVLEDQSAIQDDESDDPDTQVLPPTDFQPKNGRRTVSSNRV